MSAPIHAPSASIGINIPLGTPAPRLSVVANSLSTSTIKSVTTIGDENTLVTDISVVPPCVPTASISAWPPPIAYTVISPTAPANKNGRSIRTVPLSAVRRENSFLSKKPSL